MNLDQLFSRIGRAPNKLEESFIESMFLSAKSTSLFLRELSYLESEKTVKNHSILLCSQTKFNPNAAQKLLVEGYQPSIKLKFSAGNIILGNKFLTAKQNKLEHGDHFIFIPKTGAHNVFINQLIKSSLDLRILALDPKSLGYYLINTAFAMGAGIRLFLKKSNEIQTLLLNKKRGSLIIIKAAFVDRLFKMSGEFSLELIKVGELTKSKNIIIEHDQNRLLNISSGLFDPLLILNSKFTIPPDIKELTPAPELLNDKKNYNHDVLFLLRSLKINDNKSAVPDKSGAGIGDSLWTKQNKNGISGISVNDNIHLKYDNLQTKSRSYLANAARKMVCIGIKPDICSVIIQYNQENKTSRLFLKGFKEMAQVLRLRISSPTFAVNKKNTDGIAAAAGSKIGTDLLPKGFQTAGDFISILGSHRGELGGGIYFQKIRKSSAGERPIVDLNMEPRIQDVVYTGIMSGLIQSAKPVSGGGLVIALAQVLSESKDPLGARVFLARKLRNDELLFGETQGMVLLSIKENDLMEFERVCMALGVPTTTIGRVTDTSLFNFNDIVNLTVKDIKSNS